MDEALDGARTHLAQLGHWLEDLKLFLGANDGEFTDGQRYELFKNIQAIGCVLVDTVNIFSGLSIPGFDKTGYHKI